MDEEGFFGCFEAVFVEFLVMRVRRQKIQSRSENEMKKKEWLTSVTALRSRATGFSGGSLVEPSSLRRSSVRPL